MKINKGFILRTIAIYLILLGLAKTPVMFDKGLDPANLFQLFAAVILFVYRSLVFAVLPAVLSFRVLSILFRRSKGTSQT